MEIEQASQRLIIISTIDHIINVMLPHLDGARKIGYDVHVACHFTRFKDDIAEHCDGLHSVSLQRNPLDPRNILALFQLIKIIRKLRPDIVHCHNPSGGFIGRLAATLAKTGAKRVYTAHGFHFHPLGNKFSNAIYRFIESFAGRFLSDAVITINQWDFEEAKKLMPESRVYFTHGVGVSTDIFDPKTVIPKERQAIRDEFNVPDRGILITCIGELIPRKNQRAAIEALKSLSNKIQAVFVGDGRDEVSLQAQVTENIHFAGFRRDTRAILAATDIFLFPSLQEGLPCAIQEALSMEVPVVCYAIRGCTDMVENTCGRTSIAHNPDQLAAALQEILALTTEERKTLGKAGRQKMIEHYSRPKCVAEWLEIYAQLRGGKG